MTWPLVESLNAMRPQLPRALFTRRAVGRMLSIARAARGSMDAFGFECRLARGAERVDLGTRLEPGVAAASGRARGGRGPDVGADGPLRRLSSEPERFCRLVSSVFLEYDADSSPRAPTPSIFLELRSGRDVERGGGRCPGFFEVRRLLLDLMGPGRIAPCEEALALCFQELPRGGVVLVAGAMLGRSPQRARVSVSISKNRIGAYLGRLGWPHWDREVSDIVRRLASRRAPVVIDFDVGARVGPKVGVHFPSAGGLSVRHLLDELVGLGLCTTAKRRAVLAWPRVTRVRLRRRGWPCRFERYLNHVKVTFAGGEVCEAKAYLGVAPGFSLIG